MADIDVKRAHDLGLPGAREAAEKLAADLGKKFDLKGTWSGNVLHFERPGVKGMLAIDEKVMHLTVSLGFLLKAMRGPIEGAITEKLDALLPVSKQGAKPATPKKASAHSKKGG
jgi:putative polyhydroxyalkanoate system protein